MYVSEPIYRESWRVKGHCLICIERRPQPYFSELSVPLAGRLNVTINFIYTSLQCYSLVHRCKGRKSLLDPEDKVLLRKSRISWRRLNYICIPRRVLMVRSTRRTLRPEWRQLTFSRQTLIWGFRPFIYTRACFEDRVHVPPGHSRTC